MSLWKPWKPAISQGATLSTAIMVGGAGRARLCCFEPGDRDFCRERRIVEFGGEFGEPIERSLVVGFGGCRHRERGHFLRGTGVRTLEDAFGERELQGQVGQQRSIVRAPIAGASNRTSTNLSKAGSYRPVTAGTPSGFAILEVGDAS